MNKNYLIVAAVVALLLVAGAGYAFKHQIKTLLMGQQQTPVETSTPAPTSAVPASTESGVTEKVAVVEVDYTATGFSPKTVTVKKGTTVKFVNQSGSPMDVASNPHPVHTDYPGFDQYKSDARGKDEYDFTFDKVGTWGYHNHLNSSDTGTVIVTE